MTTILAPAPTTEIAYVPGAVHSLQLSADLLAMTELVFAQFDKLGVPLPVRVVRHGAEDVVYVWANGSAALALTSAPDETHVAAVRIAGAGVWSSRDVVRIVRVLARKEFRAKLG